MFGCLKDIPRKKKYAVLYMQDGQMLFDSTNNWNKQEWKMDEALTQLMESSAITDCIVVGIYNSGSTRHSEYCPQKPAQSLPKHYLDSIITTATRANGYKIFSGQIQSDHYLRFLATELKPFIDSNFSVYTTASHTFIGGSSMGALISLYALCEYPQVFGGAMCLSTHWTVLFEHKNNLVPGAIAKYLLDHLPKAGQHRIYFDYGDQTTDSLYSIHQQAVDKIMLKKGYAEKNWMSKYYPGENHSEKAWSARLTIPLRFILQKQ